MFQNKDDRLSVYFVQRSNVMLLTGSMRPLILFLQRFSSDSISFAMLQSEVIEKEL